MFAAEHRATLKLLTPAKVAEAAKNVIMPEDEDVQLTAEDVAIDITLLHL